MSTFTSLLRKDSNSSTLVDNLANLLLSQEKVQERLISQLQRLENRDNQLVDALRQIRSGLVALQVENKEYHREHLRGEKQKIQTQRAVLRELQEVNRPTHSNSNSRLYLVRKAVRSNEGRWQHKLLDNQNLPLDETLGDVSINNLSLKTLIRKKEGPPQQHLQSCVAAPQSNHKPAKSPRQVQLQPQQPPHLSPKQQNQSDQTKPYESQHVQVPFDNYRISSLYDYEKLAPKIAYWTGHLYSVLSEQTFEHARKRHLTKQQMKVYFSSNLILNSVAFMGYVSRNYPYIWRPYRNEIIEHFNLQSKNALKYLMIKYAINRRECVDHWCDQYIRQVNAMQAPENDSLSTARIRFDFNKQKHYAGKIKEVLNLYIRMTKKYFGMFQREVNKSVTINQQVAQQEYGYVVTAPDQPNGSYMMGNSKIDPSFLGPYYDPMMPSVPEMSPILTPKNMYKSRQPGAPLDQGPAVPPSQPTKTVKTLVGSKFRSNTGLYMPDELKEKGIKIKTAEVLRVIIKWIEDLEKKLNDINKYTVQREWPFPHREANKQPVQLSSCEKELLRDTINASIEKFRAVHQQNSEVRAVLAALHSCIEMNKNGFQFIPENEVVVGLATYILSEPVSKITVSYLESLIHCLLEGESNFNAKSNRQPISLVSFGVFDLLRAKCTGTKQQITEVYGNLIESKQLKVVRVKNRLDSINRDFLVNVRLVGTPLICEIQLEIDNESQRVDSEHKLLSGFSHFLYELDRSKYGPLIEAVIANNHLCPTIPYFESELKEVRIKTLDFEVHFNSLTREVSVEDYSRVTEEAPFTCSNCWRYVYPQESFMQSFEQEDRQHRDQYKRVCGQCVVERLPRKLKKQYLLGDLAPAFQEIKISDLTYMQTSSRRYVCLVLAGVKKNVRVLEVQLSHKHTLELTDTFLMAVRCGEMYELQDLSICYVFRLANEVPVKHINSLDLSPNDQVSNPQLSIQTLLNRKQIYLAIELSSRKKLVLDELLESPSQLSAKECRINNLRGICEHLKEETEGGKQSRTRFKDFVESEVIEIRNKHINCIDLFLTKQLKQLNISNNIVAQLELKGTRLESLEELKVSNNLLQQVKIDARSFPNLRVLQAGFNVVQNVLIGEGMLLLSELNFEHNKLLSIESFAKAALPSLKSLILDYNGTVSADFKDSNLGELRILSLRHNCLAEISSLSALAKLEELNLSNNFLQEFLFDCHNHVGSLAKLDLTANRLVRTQWTNPQNLQQLLLGFNYLQSFDADHFQEGKLAKLSLSCNRLTQISCDWHKLPLLKDLELDRNKLTEGKYDRTSFRPVPYVKLMETRRFLYDFSDEEVANIFNWQLNQLPAEHADAIIKFIAEQNDARVSIPVGAVAPHIRFEFAEGNAARDLINSYSLTPEDNPITSARPLDFRTSSLSINQATRFRRLIDEM